LVPATVTRAYISRLVCRESIEVPCWVGIDSTSRYHPPPRGGCRLGFGGQTTTMWAVQHCGQRPTSQAAWAARRSVT